MIDLHAHLVSSRFDADRQSVLERAWGAGVQQVVVVAEDLEESRRVLDLCETDPRLLPAAGIHPDRFAEDRAEPSEDEVAAFEAFVRSQRSRLVAIGEVGLDRWWVRSDERRARQEGFLERLVGLSLEVDLPLNLHSRSAGRRCLELLAACGAKRVHLHAYDGRVGPAREAAEKHGWLFSIPPTVVRSEQKQKLARVLPPEAIGLETDSPVLGPVREERNEPANLQVACRVVAGLRGTREEEIAELTTANARRLLGRSA